MGQKGYVHEIEDFGLDNYSVQLNEALFHNANGYIGVRYDLEEEYPDDYTFNPGQYINGFYDSIEVSHPERLYGFIDDKQFMVDVANTQIIKLFIDGEPFSMYQGTVLSRKLSLHMDKGTTVREVKWRSRSGKEVEIKITRMASFYQPSLFTIEYEVTPLNFSGNVVIESSHDVNVENYYNPADPRASSPCEKCLNPTNCEIRDKGSYIGAITSKSGLQVYSGVKHLISIEDEPIETDPEFMVSQHTAICVFRPSVNQGEKITLTKYAVFCDSIRFGNCKERAYTEMDRAVSKPLKELYENQEAYLKDYWDNCLVDIEGDDEANIALRYNLYQLIQSVGKDRYSNISPKGLSGEGYEGHYFWDSEMYIQPFFTITNPEISRQLIAFRYETLEAARENAVILGHQKGALYPWRTLDGSESSGYFPAGSAQYHINGAVAYSIIAYYLATGDINLIKEEGAEIIFETARLWVNVANYYKEQFHINDVTGPDEYTCIVNNNYYTNVLAQYHLKWAIKFYDMLSGTPELEKIAEKIQLTTQDIDEFKLVAEKMYLPYDEDLKINPQDDSFLKKSEWVPETSIKKKTPLLLHYHPLHLYRHQICKQADTVLAHFILEDAQTEEVIRNSYEYYEKRTVHDSSLSRCIFSIMAARLGMNDKAVAYFGESIKLDLLDLHGNTKDGVHTANMGGSYMVIVHGFGGFRLKESGVHFHPILPNKWQGYRFKISYLGSRISVHVSGETCKFTLEKGEAQDINVYNKSYSLETEVTVNLE
jgi:alpha,alpha-trehalose phosphorylase